MPNLNLIKQSFDTRLKAGWTITPIAFDNDNYEKGSNPWIRAVLNPNLSENADLNGLVRHYGIYRISVFTPLNSGTGIAWEYAVTLANLFKNTTIDDITCYASDIRRIGDDGNGWYMLNILVNFWAHE